MVHSAVAEDTPFAKTQGPPKSSVGGTPDWNLVPSARKDGWPPGLDRSVRRDFRPDLSAAFRGSAVTKPMATAFVSFQRGTPSRLCCVYGSA